MTGTRELVERMRENKTKLAIFNTVRRLGMVTALEIESEVDSSRPTILKYLDELVEEGLVVGQVHRSSGGRPPRIFGVNSSAAFSVGVDFGAPNLSFVLINLAKEVVDKMEVQTDLKEPPSVTANWIVEGVRKMADIDGVRLEDQVLAVAVGLPCPIERCTELVQPIPRLPQWKDVPLKAILERELDLPVYVEVGPHLMVLGEKEFEEASRNMVYIHVREGIGMGAIVDGRLMKGANEDIGEIGHTIVSPGGPRCICGRRGCLEVFTSEPAIVGRARELMERDVTPTEVFVAAREGDAVAREVVGEALDHLAIAIINVAMLFDPEVIVLGGNIVQGGDFVIERLKDRLREHRLENLDRGMRLKFSRLGIYTGALGAANFALEKSLELPS
ncbi:MAG TPA: ROK family transcriptional regulator [Candidatus Latescibacteria bacterium]|nr:ROK family transcriptional regulator [Candidatus Latescibacterota bacterium]